MITNEEFIKKLFNTITLPAFFKSEEELREMWSSPITRNTLLKKLTEWGFKTNPLNKLTTGIKNLMKNYNEIEKKRDQIDFDIDGIVYKVDSFELQKRLGLK